MAKRKTESTDILEKYSEFIYNKEHNKTENIISVSTGSLSLDVSTGIGGIPLGRFTEVYGSESCGKTTLALSTATRALNKGMRVLYIDAENTLSYEYATAILGQELDEERFTILQPETMEQSLEMCEDGIQSGQFEFVVLDSIGSLAPEKVKKDDLTDANVALLARLMTTWVQRNAYAVRQNNIAFLGVNQVRDKIGSYIGGYETPGGHQWKHNASIRIMLSKIADIKKGEEIIGINTRFIVKKNKVAPPFRTSMFPIIFGKGIDTVRDTVQFAQLLGIIDNAGPYYRYQGESIAKGMNNLIELLENTPETLDKIQKECYSNVNSDKLPIADEEREDE